MLMIQFGLKWGQSIAPGGVLVVDAYRDPVTPSILFLVLHIMVITINLL